MVKQDDGWRLPDELWEQRRRCYHLESPSIGLPQSAHARSVGNERPFFCGPYRLSVECTRLHWYLFEHVGLLMIPGMP